MVASGVRLIDEPEEALDPRERALLRIARVLLGGALANGAVLVFLLLLALAGGLGLLPGVFTTAQNLLAGSLELAPAARWLSSLCCCWWTAACCWC